jgi:glucose/arabinose dehydrogenase
MKTLIKGAALCIFYFLTIFIFSGCKMAPLQVIAQPREVKAVPTEIPQVPEPDPVAAQVPAGYQVEVAVKGLTYPSSVDFDDRGNMFVAECGYVYGDPNAPARIFRINRSGKSEIIADHLSGPVTDVLWHQGKLYLSQKGKISVLEGKNIRDIVTGLPSLGDHHNNQLAAGPDGKLYLGQGTVSNAGIIGIDNYVFGWLQEYPEFHDVSPYPLDLRGQTFASINPLKLSTEKERLLARTGAFQAFDSTGQKTVSPNTKANGTILRFNTDGSELEVYAWGLRNPFGLAWGPNGKLYVSENGFDARGSRQIANAPDCLWEIRQGAWYGWPDFAGGVPVTDPRFKPTHAPQPEFILAKHPPVEKPLLNITPHVGLTKMDFSRSEKFGFAGQVFCAAVGDMQPVTGNEKRPVGFEVFRFDPKTGQTESFFRARSESLGREYEEYVTTPGPRRLVDVRFSPEEDSLYVVDVGPILVYPSASPVPHPFPNTGTIWRISREGTKPQFPSGITMETIAIQEKAGAEKASDKKQQ